MHVFFSYGVLCTVPEKKGDIEIRRHAFQCWIRKKQWTICFFSSLLCPVPKPVCLPSGKKKKKWKKKQQKIKIKTKQQQKKRTVTTLHVTVDTFSVICFAFFFQSNFTIFLYCLDRFSLLVCMTPYFIFWGFLMYMIIVIWSYGGLWNALYWIALN